MNHLCQSCPKDCEEVIPTYNCKYQMENEKRELLVEFLNEFKNVHATMYHNIDNIIEELKNAPQQQVLVQQPRVANMATVISDFEQLSFTDKRTVYHSLFSLGHIGDAIDNKLILISLIGSFYIKAKEKSPEITVLDAVNKLIDDTSLVTDNFSHIQAYKEKIAILVEDFVYGVNKGNTFGIKNAAELRVKVNEIVKQQLPF